MNTQEPAKEVSRFIILVPHRDSLKPVEEYRKRLFAAGFAGAYSFPLSAPLAVVSRPFSREELKALARTIRDFTVSTSGTSGTSGTNGKILTTERREAIQTAARCSWLDLPLSLSMDESFFPEATKEKLVSIFSPPTLRVALVDSGETPPAREEPPVLSFRAAYLANLIIRPLPAGDPRYSFEWRIGHPVWLPKH